MMESRHQNLAKLLQKNENWLWFGPNTLLGDATIDQYAGLKVFIRYILDHRASILDNREDKGVDFIAGGDNSLCRNFIKFLQQKTEAEQDEKNKEQYAWMVNRAEAMMQMKDPDLGQMNDGIFLAYAFTLFKLGESASPRIDVNENSIVGLLEDGFQNCRRENPNIGNLIDKIENKQTPTLTPAGGGSIAPYAPSIPQVREIEEGGAEGYEGGGEPVSYTDREFGKKEVPGKAKETSGKPETPQEKGKTEEPEEEPGEETEESTPEISLERGDEELLPTTFAGTPGTTGPTGVAGTAGAEGAGAGVEPIAKEKTIKKGKRYVPKLSKLRVIPEGGGMRKRKKLKGPQKGIEKEKQRQQESQLPQIPTAVPAAPPRNPLPSGGWKIAKKAGKIIAGSSVGAGTVWAAASSPEATAKVFAFIHLFF